MTAGIFANEHMITQVWKLQTRKSSSQSQSVDKPEASEIRLHPSSLALNDFLQRLGREGVRRCVE